MIRQLFTLCLLGTSLIATAQTAATPTSWTADNGNGTYTNPLFYDEFSDPDLIRVGDDFYLAGTTMVSLPGLVVLHSKDLVNWEFMSYCFNSFEELGFTADKYRLKNGKEFYGQGIWAPCIRYNDGKFYVFSNINGEGLQVFVSENLAGPWKHINMGGRIYDLSILFDDDGRVYAIHGYNEVHATEIKPDFSGFVEGSDRVIIAAGNAMGEGHHVYKIGGKYYILSANYAPCGRIQCARADKIDGPYETVTIAAKETMGVRNYHLTTNLGRTLPTFGADLKIQGGDDNSFGAVPLHQGGIVDLPNGDWWGFSLTDFRGVGRTTSISPVTWVDGWPYFGLPGNLGRSPRTWTKPAINPSPLGGEQERGFSSSERAERGFSYPYERSFDFNAKTLPPVWQWNHESDKSMWSLAGGKLHLKTMPATDFLWARNTLTQRCIGPVSTATVDLDISKLKDGDVAGFALLNLPYSLISVEREGKALHINMKDQLTKADIYEKNVEGKLKKTIKLRIRVDLDEDWAWYSYSTDGTTFTEMGDSVRLGYQLKTFQGSRYSLFAYNKGAKNGGEAIFDNFTVNQPMADRSGNLPTGKVIELRNKANGSYAWANPHGMLHTAWAGSNEYKNKGCFFKVHDRGNGKVALEAMNGTGFLTVVGLGLSADVRLTKEESEGSLFMWQDMLRGDCMLLSMKTQRYVGVNPTTGEPYGADWTGCDPDRRDGTVFEWREVESDGIPSTPDKQLIY